MNSTDKMMIAQVMLSAGFGGAERLFVDLCRALADRGHGIAAVCHPDFAGLSLLQYPGIQIFPLKVHVDSNPFAQFRFKKMMESFRPQLIHCHLARSATIAGKIAQVLHICSVANLHNYVNLKYYRKIDFFLPATNDQRRYLLECGISDDRISVIPHFTPLPAKTFVSDSVITPITFISYGRWVKIKGFHLLLQALKKLREQGFEARLILGGDGPERANLLNLIDELKLQKYVSLPGWVEDVAEFLSGSSIFVLPSLEEAFGIVVLEAMSQGKIILSTTARGPSEILNGETAYLFPTGDVSMMASAMGHVCRHIEEAERKAENALKEFKVRYSADKVLPIFESIYHRMILKG